MAPAPSARTDLSSALPIAPPELACPPAPVAPPVSAPAVFWSTMDPIKVGFALCGVSVIVFPDVQYEYWTSPTSPEIVRTLPDDE